MSADDHHQTALTAIFGQPALPPGESPDAYALLSMQLRELLKPENILDEICLQDLIDSIWESQRFKRLRTRLISGLCREALEQLLVPLCGNPLHRSGSIARNYYGEDATAQTAARDELKKFGITDDQIQAKACTMATKQFDFFERLLANRTGARKTLLKEYDRLQKRGAKTASRPARPVPDETNPQMASSRLPFQVS